MAKKKQGQEKSKAGAENQKPAQEKKQQSPKQQENVHKAQESEGKGRKQAIYSVIALVLIIAAVAIAIYVIYFNTGPTQPGASFSEFRSNFDAAPRVAVLLSFSNNTQLNYELQCSTSVLQVLSSKRSPSTIDFFEVNQTSCYYSHGLGYPINLTNPNVSTCIGDAQAEPSISFNYSTTFSNTITSQHMYLSGNDIFFKSCPIAVDLR